MNDPELYRKTMALKYMDRVDFLKECIPSISWRPDGKDSLLDIGCAGGDFTIEYIQPILPKTFSRLVGVDINVTMVEYARKHFSQSNISFDILDIGGDISEFLNKYERFDHLTSFLSLHLVPDQKIALKNIFNLLTPNGDCLLYIIAEWSGHDVYKKMFCNWTEYMEDVDNFISHYSQRANPTYMLRKYLENAGFSECKITERRCITVYNDLKQYEEFYKSVSPFYNRIPCDRQNEFMREFVKLSMETKPEVNHLKNELELRVPHTFLAVYAKK